MNNKEQQSSHGSKERDVIKRMIGISGMYQFLDPVTEQYYKSFLYNRCPSFVTALLGLINYIQNLRSIFFIAKPGDYSRSNPLQDWLERQRRVSKKLKINPQDFVYALTGLYRPFGIEPEIRIAAWLSTKIDDPYPQRNDKKWTFQDEFEIFLQKALDNALSSESESKSERQKDDQKIDCIDALVYWSIILNPNDAVRVLAKYGSEEQFNSLINQISQKDQSLVNKLNELRANFRTEDTDIIEQRNAVSEYITQKGILNLIAFMFQDQVRKRKSLIKLSHSQMIVIGLLSPNAAALIYNLIPGLIEALSEKEIAHILLLPNTVEKSKEKNASAFAHTFLYEYIIKYQFFDLNILLESLKSGLADNDIYKGKRIIPSSVKDFLKFALKNQKVRVDALNIILDVISSMVLKTLFAVDGSEIDQRLFKQTVEKAGNMTSSLLGVLRGLKLDKIPDDIKDRLKNIAERFVNNVSNLIDQLTRVPPEENYGNLTYKEQRLKTSLEKIGPAFSIFFNEFPLIYPDWSEKWNLINECYNEKIASILNTQNTTRVKITNN